MSRKAEILKKVAQTPNPGPLPLENRPSYELAKITAQAQGIDKSYLERPETLYYDESGNIKHLRIKSGKLNVDYREVFVLGGVQAEEPISKEELGAAYAREKEDELKANEILRGDFLQILRKQYFTNTMQLIERKDWHIHFCAVQVLYYAFVDIVDSVEMLRHNPFLFKAALYDVLKSDIERTVKHFRKYQYPNIAGVKIAEFLDGIISMVDDYLKTENDLDRIVQLTYMRNVMKEAKQQKELVFIQDEVSNEWVTEFTQFYRQEIYTFAEKTLIMDEEKVVHRDICDQTIMLMDGKPMCNFIFDDSNDNPMIQVSDMVVGILRKYFLFLDRGDEEIEADIASMADDQMANFRQMNRVLKKSLAYNPMFVHMIASQKVVGRYNRYMEIYG